MPICIWQHAGKSFWISIFSGIWALAGFRNVPFFTNIYSSLSRFRVAVAGIVFLDIIEFLNIF